MMRAGFARNESAVIRQQVRLRRGRYMQYMEPMAVEKREVKRSPCSDHRRFMVAYARMVGHVLRSGELCRVRPHRCFIFTMCRNRKRCIREDPLKGFLLIDKQVAGARTD